MWDVNACAMKHTLNHEGTVRAQSSTAMLGALHRAPDEQKPSLAALGSLLEPTPDLTCQELSVHGSPVAGERALP